MPDAYAIALMVVLLETGTGTGPVHMVPVVEVGFVPSVVYRIVAPIVVLVIVTFCVDE
jgi:hypothetical protein